MEVSMRKLISFFAFTACCLVATAAYSEEVSTEVEQIAQDESVVKNDAKLFKKDQEDKTNSGCPCTGKPKN